MSHYYHAHRWLFFRQYPIVLVYRLGYFGRMAYFEMCRDTLKKYAQI